MNEKKNQKTENERIMKRYRSSINKQLLNKEQK